MTRVSVPATAVLPPCHTATSGANCSSLCRHVMNLQSSLPCSQQLNTCSPSEPSISSPSVSHIRLLLPSSPFSFEFLTKTLHAFLFFPTRAICRTHLLSSNTAVNCCALLMYRVIQKEGTLPRVHTEVMCIGC